MINYISFRSHSWRRSLDRSRIWNNFIFKPAMLQRFTKSFLFTIGYNLSSIFGEL